METPIDTIILHTPESELISPTTEEFCMEFCVWILQMKKLHLLLSEIQR